MTATITREDTVTGMDQRLDGSNGLDGGWQVVILNDNVHSFNFVVDILMRTFDHSKAMAFKVANEAHNRGRAIAQVEEEEAATKHCMMLRGAGLGSYVEKVEL